MGAALAIFYAAGAVWLAHALYREERDHHYDPPAQWNLPRCVAVLALWPLTLLVAGFMVWRKRWRCRA